MSTASKPGIGAVLNRWDDSASTGVFAEIVEVTNLSWDGASRESIEVFKLNNSDEYVNKVQGVLNANTISATVLYTRDQFIQLKGDMETRGNRNYQIVLPDGEGIEWSGFITELPLDIGSEDVMQGDVTFEIDGKADFLSVAST